MARGQFDPAALALQLAHIGLCTASSREAQEVQARCADAAAAACETWRRSHTLESESRRVHKRHIRLRQERREALRLEAQEDRATYQAVPA